MEALSLLKSLFSNNFSFCQVGKTITTTTTITTAAATNRACTQEAKAGESQA